jgi:hypothetical protein
MSQRLAALQNSRYPSAVRDVLLLLTALHTKDMLFVVLSAGKSPTRPFDVLYRGVVCFDFRHCRIGGNEDSGNLWRPGSRTVL